MKRELMAVFGKVNLTPDEPTPLQGYDPDTYIADPTTDLLDEIYARILLLDDGINRYGFISIDCCLTNEQTIWACAGYGKPEQHREFIPTFPESTRGSWAQAAGVDKSYMSVTPTHTHTAPAHFSEKYTKKVEEKIVELKEQFVPVRVKTAQGKSAVSAYRRPDLLPHLDIPIDQTLNVLLFESVQGKMLGCIVNFSAHLTVVNNPLNRISADFAGLAMNELESRYGNGFVSLFLQGFEGDICPIYGQYGDEGDTYPLAKMLGGIFTGDIAKVAAESRYFTAYPLKALEKVVKFPIKAHYSKLCPDLTLKAVRIGDAAILFVSAEVFNEFMNKIRQHFPSQIILFSGLCNGYSGYLPTQEAFLDGQGGYEILTTPFTKEADPLFVKEAVELIKGVLA
ncbi:MAG: hypothetical protein Q7J78_03615 [Clostridiales bacterium]|nr:hypothetical protein [Clostridiales bacterium]